MVRTFAAEKPLKADDAESTVLAQSMVEAFDRDFNALEKVFSMIDRFMDEHTVPEGPRFAVTLAVEELFTNMVKYNPDGAEPVRLELEVENGTLAVVMVDSDSSPFDITQLRDVDVKAGIQQRRPGGLGLFLVQRLMDEVKYEFRHGETRITLVKVL